MGGRGGAGGGIGAGEFGRGRGMSLARFLSQQDILSLLRLQRFPPLLYFLFGL